MSSEWHRGVLTASSWHGLEDIGVMADDQAMIAHGESSGAWPIAIRFADVFATSQDGEPFKLQGRALLLPTQRTLTRASPSSVIATARRLRRSGEVSSRPLARQAPSQPGHSPSGKARAC